MRLSKTPLPRIKLLVLLPLLLFFLPQEVAAFSLPGSPSHPAMDRLQSFVNRMRSLEADFVQRVEDPSGGTPTESRGRFLTARPGRFRWDYKTPYEQTIVSDGHSIWFFEPDLRQVTIADAARMDRTPAAFLVSGARIGDYFFLEGVYRSSLEAAGRSSPAS